MLELYSLKRQPVEERAPRRRGAAGPVQPWPTTWFVDESLSARIAALEAKGWVGRLERRLNADPNALQEAEAAHAAVGMERWAALTESDRQLAEERGWQKALRDVGIAGIQSPRKVNGCDGRGRWSLRSGSASCLMRARIQKRRLLEECVVAVVDDDARPPPKMGGRDRAHKRWQSGHSTAVPRPRVRFAPSAHFARRGHRDAS